MLRLGMAIFQMKDAVAGGLEKPYPQKPRVGHLVGLPACINDLCRTGQYCHGLESTMGVPPDVLPPAYTGSIGIHYA